MSTALSGDSLLFAKRVICSRSPAKVTVCLSGYGSKLSLLREAQGELASPNAMRLRQNGPPSHRGDASRSCVRARAYADANHVSRGNEASEVVRDT